ncbi:MAG: hypothetical protein ACPGVG_11130, partial [Mycobacterium sp.]
TDYPSTNATPPADDRSTAAAYVMSSGATTKKIAFYGVFLNAAGEVVPGGSLTPRVVMLGAAGHVIHRPAASAIAGQEVADLDVAPGGQAFYVEITAATAPVGGVTMELYFKETE